MIASRIPFQIYSYFRGIESGGKLIKAGFLKKWRTINFNFNTSSSGSFIRIIHKKLKSIKLPATTQVSKMPLINGGLFSLQDSTTRICMSLMVELIFIPFRYSVMAMAILYSPALCGDLQIKLPVLESKLTALFIPGKI